MAVLMLPYSRLVSYHGACRKESISFLQAFLLLLDRLHVTSAAFTLLPRKDIITFLGTDFTVQKLVVVRLDFPEDFSEL
jgi:hypothetical protein